jgi:uncharacterized protein (TIGR00730 family)
MTDNQTVPAANLAKADSTSAVESDAELDRKPAELAAAIEDLLDRVGARRNRDQLREIVQSALALAGDDAERLDLKLTNAALAEMRRAFAAFAPYRSIPKATMFGSARTRTDDPLYEQARAMAHELAQAGWMMVTGAGPGIMAAGMEGAGRDRSFGVTIRLPFEEGANPIIAGDDKLVAMKYFFTRKLMLVKESRAFVALPGGFGTLDEVFELLTLVQTGKGEPVPIVLLDVPDGTYWKHWETFVRHELAGRQLIAEHDIDLYHITDDVPTACRLITGFYANYESMRFSREKLVIRLRRAPNDEQLASLNEQFGSLAVRGKIERTAPLAIERREDDKLELARIVLDFDRRRFGRLPALIHALNEF